MNPSHLQYIAKERNDTMNMTAREGQFEGGAANAIHEWGVAGLEEDVSVSTSII